jgi:beta-galactosidase
MKAELNQSLSEVQWFGRGPWENYNDRCSGAITGQYSRDIKEFFVPYVRPQSMGNREEARWIAMLNGDNRGALFVANDKMAFTALNYNEQQIDQADHLNELPLNDKVWLYLDYQQRGLGNASCGPGVLPEYILKPEPVNFAFSIRPYLNNEKNYDETATGKIKLSRPEIILNQNKVKIKNNENAGTVYFTTDGSEPTQNSKVYTTPISINKDMTIKARVFADNFKPSSTVGKFFYKPIEEIPVDKNQWKIKYSDSHEEGRPASNIIDGNPHSFWHTEWSKKVTKHPHEVVVDLGEIYKIAGVKLLPRQDGSENGSIKEFEILLSTDGEAWKPIVKDFLQEPKKLNFVRFGYNFEGRYVKLIARSSFNGPWTSLAEFDIAATGK